VADGLKKLFQPHLDNHPAAVQVACGDAGAGSEDFGLESVVFAHHAPQRVQEVAVGGQPSPLLHLVEGGRGRHDHLAAQPCLHGIAEVHGVEMPVETGALVEPDLPEHLGSQGEAALVQRADLRGAVDGRVAHGLPRSEETQVGDQLPRVARRPLPACRPHQPQGIFRQQPHHRQVELVGLEREVLVAEHENLAQLLAVTLKLRVEGLRRAAVGMRSRVDEQQPHGQPLGLQEAERGQEHPLELRVVVRAAYVGHRGLRGGCALGFLHRFLSFSGQMARGLAPLPGRLGSLSRRVSAPSFCKGRQISTIFVACSRGISLSLHVEAPRRAPLEAGVRGRSALQTRFIPWLKTHFLSKARTPGSLEPATA